MPALHVLPTTAWPPADLHQEARLVAQLLLKLVRVLAAAIQGIKSMQLGRVFACEAGLHKRDYLPSLQPRLVTTTAYSVAIPPEDVDELRANGLAFA